VSEEEVDEGVVWLDWRGEVGGGGSGLKVISSCGEVREEKSEEEEDRSRFETCSKHRENSSEKLNGQKVRKNFLPDCW